MRRLLLWWWRRPGRTPRPLRMGISLVLMSVALVSLEAPPSSGAGSASAPGGPPTNLPNAPGKAPEPPGPGALTTRFPSSPALISEGRSLYDNGCASCHGEALRGVADNAPSLIGVGAGPVDFYLSTGRMPLQSPRIEPTRGKPLYTRQQIDALIAFIVHTGGGPRAPAADPSRRDSGRGLSRLHRQLRGLPSDRRPRRPHPRRLRAQPAAGASRCRSPRRCGWVRISCRTSMPSRSTSTSSIR